MAHAGGQYATSILDGGLARQRLGGEQLLLRADGLAAADTVVGAAHARAVPVEVRPGPCNAAKSGSPDRVSKGTKTSCRRREPSEHAGTPQAALLAGMSAECKALPQGGTQHGSHSQASGVLGAPRAFADDAGEVLKAAHADGLGGAGAAAGHAPQSGKTQPAGRACARGGHGPLSAHLGPSNAAPRWPNAPCGSNRALQRACRRARCSPA